jgi:peptidoglycan/xylan/chitin deacetylase (PgdA/CDA1 family)
VFKTIALLLGLLLSGSVIAQVGACVVLLYHHIDDNTPKSTSISPDLFESHLQYLQKNNFQVLPLEDMINKLQQKKLPDKCVVLTADDAYLSIYTKAYPLLKKYKMPMAVFVSTKAMDKRYRAMMDWKEVQKSQDTLSFYNHSEAHRHLIELETDEAIADLKRSEQVLNTKIGVRKKIIAYPYGESTPELLQQLQIMNYIGFGQHSGVVSQYSDFQNLPRFPMASSFANMKAFKLKVNTQPMPVLPISRELRVQTNPPHLRLHFNKALTSSQQKNFQCFSRGGVKLTWEDSKSVEIVANLALTARRSKYNCTLPSTEKGRYYWYSVQWILPQVKEN